MADIEPSKCRVAVIEDHLLFAKVLTEHAARSTTTGRDLAIRAIIDHSEALTWTGWDEIDVVLIDAIQHWTNVHRRPRNMLLNGPLVATELKARHPHLTLIGYCAAADAPEINITFRQTGVVDAIYDQDALTENLPSIVLDGDHRNQAAEPGEAAFARLGLTSDARLWDGLVAMRHRRPRDRFAHGDAWEQVVRTSPSTKIENRTREYINDKVGPLLGITTGHGRYRKVCDILRRVAYVRDI